MHSVIPFGDDDTETSQTLQRLLTDAWLRPYMRPRWLKVDPHRAHISDEFINWCEQRGIEVTRQKVEHHAQLFELMLEDVLAEMQPQTEPEWRECLDALQEAKNSQSSVSGLSPMRLEFGRNPEIPGNLLSDNPDLISNSSVLHDRRRTGSGSEGSDNRKNEVDASFGQVECKESIGHQTASGTDVPSRRRGGIPGMRAHHRWRPGICTGAVRGNFWIVIKASPEQLRPAAREDRHAWRLVEAELRPPV